MLTKLRKGYWTVSVRVFPASTEMAASVMSEFIEDRVQSRLLANRTFTDKTLKSGN